MNNDRKTKRLTFYGMSLALALVLSYVEAMIPIGIGIPGAKIGLANIVTVMLLYSSGASAAFTVGLFRIILSGFMFGNLFAIFYSSAGFILSFAVMFVLKKSRHFGILGVSTAGGVMHNAGQLAAAVFLTNRAVLAYFPVLFAAGVAAGAVIGLLGGILSRRLEAFLKRL